MKFLFTTAFSIALTINLFAQFDGARTYWALPKNFNILSAHLVRANGNASINNFSFINPNATITNNLILLAYTRSQPIFGRTFYSTLILPAGDIIATLNATHVISSTLFQHGLGDIVWSNSINLLGAKGLMIKDFVRHESPTLIYLRTSVSFPTGRYESDNPVNIGSNQFKLRVGCPIVQRIGPLIDGKRMTLEVSPSYILISKNNDYQGQELKQDGLFTLETHLTRDFTTKAFISLDYSYIAGGSSEFIDKETGVTLDTQSGQNAHLMGVTINFNINDHLNLFLTHNQSIHSGNDNLSLEGTVTKLTLAWSFHDFQEKFKNYIDSN